MNKLELKVPPVMVVAISAAAMWAVSSSGPNISVPRSRLIAAVLVGGGIVFSLAGFWSFRRTKTTVNPTRPDASSAVVTTGIYRVSRNPMYTGMLLVLTGWAFFLSNVLAFLGLPLFVLYMNRFQIAPEERILATKFGDKYEHYRQTVRRWL